MNLKFWKYQGTGNDFVMLDNRGRSLEKELSQKQLAFLCNRHTGIGADGLILLSDSDSTDFHMIYYNADGAESSMCGNGGRCLVAFALQQGIEKKSYTFTAIDGLHRANIEEGIVHLEMGAPHSYQKINGKSSWIDTGSPHYVSFEETSVGKIDVYQLGKEIRYAEQFEAGGGTNVNFVNVLEPDKLRVRTYERGVENETLSCGTGVTACAYIHRMEHAPELEKIRIQTEGGELSVRILKKDPQQEKIILSGPATCVYEGNIDL